MGRLRPRQEKFCHNFVIYGCAAVSAREAGYKPAGAARQGYRLLQTERIRTRIREIQAKSTDDHCRNLDVMLGKLEAVYTRAMLDKRFYAAARAVELQARMSGLVSMRRGMAAHMTDDHATATAAEDETPLMDKIENGAASPRSVLLPPKGRNGESRTGAH